MINTHTHRKSDLKISSYSQPLLTHSRISHDHDVQRLQRWANLLALSIKDGRWSNSWCDSVMLRLVLRADRWERWDSFTRRREEKGDEKKKGKGWATLNKERGEIVGAGRQRGRGEPRGDKRRNRKENVWICVRCYRGGVSGAYVKTHSSSFLLLIRPHRAAERKP